MNTQTFRYAVELERAGSFTLAADRLFMAQPNLSKAIRELEEALGFAVFARTPRGVYPTPKGTAFLEIARSIAQQLDRMDALSRPDAAETLSLSLPRAACAAEAAARLAAELDPARGVHLRMAEADARQTLQHVAEGRYALGVVDYAAPEEAQMLALARERHLRLETLDEHDAALLLCASHPLAAAPEVHADRLRGLAQIALGEPEADRRADSAPKGSIAAQDRCGLYALLRAIPGSYAWASPLPADALARQGLVQRLCAGGARRIHEALIYPQCRTLTELEARFIDKFHQVRAEISAQGVR